jgi:septal ring factor EnvC (AmiA/AmiB activator)
MNRKNTKLQEENIATREKSLVIVRELDRIMRALNKVLKSKDDRAKAIEGDLQELGKTLEENLECLYEIDRDFEIYNKNMEKIIINLQHLEDEEETQASWYERLLNGIGIDGENQESDDALTDDAIPAENENHDLVVLENLRKRREKFLQNLSQEFESLEDKLTSINKLRKELEDSQNEIREKKADSLERKNALEDEGKKLLYEVGRLENELEITVLEEKNLIEESEKIIKCVESSLKLDEKIDHALFSSQTPDESEEVSPAIEPSENGHKIAIGI